MRRYIGRGIQSSLAGARHSRARVRRVMPGALMNLALVLVGIGAIAGAVFGGAPVARADGPTISITVPAPLSGNVSEGPVGTNVTITAEGLTPGDAYNLGYATTDIGCLAGFKPMQGPALTAQDDGSLTTTFAWPGDAKAVGTTYYVCAQDTTTPGSLPVQSQGSFKVDADSPAKISIKQAPAPTPTIGDTQGTPPLPARPPAGNGYYAGGYMEIKGNNFFPGGGQLTAYLTNVQVNAPSVFQSAEQIQTADGSPIQSNNTGQFDVTVILPGNVTPGPYYVYVISTDGSQTTWPALVAWHDIKLGTQPTPTPTQTTAPTPTPEQKAAGKAPPPKGIGGNIAGAIGLGVLSAFLFVVGVILLVSAAGMPRPTRF